VPVKRRIRRREGGIEDMLMVGRRSIIRNKGGVFLRTEILFQEWADRSLGLDELSKS
jgi:hypothetical protein